MNKKMSYLINNIEHLNSDEIFEFNLKKLNGLMIPNFVQVYDCIIISKKPLYILKENFKKAVLMHTDKIGYEAGNTEIRINDYVESINNSVQGMLQIALIVIECWLNKLKNIDKTSKFCFIISCDNENVTIRFHKVRENEKMWISKELEEYKEPVGYIIE